MELFIIGGIIVALMVYASTKIKKNAAAAYDREVVETKDFRLIKPEGFLHPLRDDSIFEAYSKDFGEGELRNVWRANAEITIENDSPARAVAQKVKQELGELISERSDSDSRGRTFVFIEAVTNVDDAEKRVFVKIFEGDDSNEVYIFKVYVLSAHLAEYRERAIEMIESFEFK